MNAFHRLTVITLLAVYFLILVGGVVRATGSGMGCPDWPRCFGNWVPPTSVNELPTNYKDSYSAYRAKKNERFAKYLSLIGFDDTADALLADKSVLEETEFNGVKTWIEYINRLVGVIIGLLIIAVTVRSFRYWNADRVMVFMSVGSLLLVVFQGWIGSFVVSSNLTPWTVTLHMFLAILLVVMLIYLAARSDSQESIFRQQFSRIWIILPMILLLAQTVFGTQVRQAIDALGENMARTEWMTSLGTEFLIHRSFSWVVLLAHVILAYKMLKSESVKRFGLALILLILGTVLSGTGMAYFNVPAFLQPIHLLVATGLFGFEVFLLFQMNRRLETVLN